MPLTHLQTRAVPRTLRSGILPIARSRAILRPPRPHPWRGFTSSRVHGRHDITKARNHYETLNVPYDASPADIKKSFYSLSKSHHPDHNPGDSSAAAKFHSIADAYAVLGTPAKRVAYDRDVISHHHPPGGANAARRGSYHSSGPAGGRPATGLSRRKTQFRGPPPSFHRSGGWGAHAHKRSAAQDESTGGNSHAHNHPEASAHAAGWSAGTKAGMGPGQDPFGHTLEPDMPHFNSARHKHSQHMQDQRRTARILRESGASGAAQDSMLSGFFAVTGVLFLTFFLPFVFFGGLRREKGKKPKAEAKKKKQTT